jgi:DNA-binding PadR family transcriptional regulator
MESLDFNGLDTVVHGPLRLGVMTALQADRALDFTTLKKRLSAGDGTLGQHLQKLEDSGYVICNKTFVGQRPKSTYRLTATGRKALARYLDTMQAIIHGAKSDSERTSASK